jgi:hypothetical protein
MRLGYETASMAFQHIRMSRARFLQCWLPEKGCATELEEVPYRLSHVEPRIGSDQGIQTNDRRETA